MAPTLTIRDFTDPGCPYAFSAEPSRWRLRWLYGDAIEWRPRMVVLSETPEDDAKKDLTPAKLARGLRSLQQRFGMPIDSRERPRLQASVAACRAVVAARLRAPGREEALLRRLRILTMGGELLDDPEAIRTAARQAGVDPADLEGWTREPEVERTLREDMAAARDPSPAARALDHKLAGWDGGRRYTCPSYEIERIADGARLDVPGFQPAESYESAIANLVPELERRAAPESAEEVLAWAGEPLATAEVAALRDEIDLSRTREELARVADEEPVGPDGYWTLRATSRRAPAPVSEIPRR